MKAWSPSDLEKNDKLMSPNKRMPKGVDFDSFDEVGPSSSLIMESPKRSKSDSNIAREEWTPSLVSASRALPDSSFNGYGDIGSPLRPRSSESFPQVCMAFTI